MSTLLTGFTVGMGSLAGTAVLLALVRLVLVQVRGLTRLTRQIADPDDQPGGPWVFADCGQPPGLALPPVHHGGDLEPWATVSIPTTGTDVGLARTRWGARS